jgi:hypothetical protein
VRALSLLNTVLGPVGVLAIAASKAPLPKTTVTSQKSNFMNFSENKNNYDPYSPSQFKFSEIKLIGLSCELSKKRLRLHKNHKNFDVPGDVMDAGPNLTSGVDFGCLNKS